MAGRPRGTGNGFYYKGLSQKFHARVTVPQCRVSTTCALHNRDSGAGVATLSLLNESLSAMGGTVAKTRDAAQSLAALSQDFTRSAQFLVGALDEFLSEAA